MKTGEVRIADSRFVPELIPPAVRALLAAELFRGLMGFPVGVNDFGVEGSQVRASTSETVDDERQSISSPDICLGVDRNFGVGIRNVFPLLVQPVFCRPDLVVVEDNSGDHAVADKVAFLRSLEGIERIEFARHSRL